MQDLHVHGRPAVEIYGVIEGRLQRWWKRVVLSAFRLLHLSANFVYVDVRIRKALPGKRR